MIRKKAGDRKMLCLLFICLLLFLFAGMMNTGAVKAVASETAAQETENINNGTALAGSEAAPDQQTAAEPQKKLELNKKKLTLVVGKTYKLKAEKTGITGKLTWKSGRKSVAGIDAAGKITAKKEGTAKITVKKGKYQATCLVTVVNASLSKKSISLTKGKTSTLKVKGYSGKVTWTSSNKAVATVNSKGKITAKKTGTATIKAKIGASILSAKVNVTYTRWDRLLDQYRKNSSVNQLIFVKYIGGSSARVVMYTKSGEKWKQIMNCAGYVGQNGIGKQREGDRRTPTGVFNLTSAYGIKDNPGAKVDYVKVNSNLYWCGDQNYYNQLIDITQKPHSCSGEHLIDYVPHYNYGMFLDYNKNNVYGKGAAIFLHCTGSNPYTAGCIAVAESQMIKIIQNAEAGAKICIYPM